MSATAFIGLRLWDNAELYFNPEIDQGSGLDATHGVSAFPKGEAQKAVFPMPRFVVDRLLWRQTFGLGGERESWATVSTKSPQRATFRAITVVAGRLAVTDFFDDNGYANDPRTNFLNWNAYGAGAYDWTMDQISWTWGALAELNQNDWALRVGYFLLPIVSSNNSFDTHIPVSRRVPFEWEWRYTLLLPLGSEATRVYAWMNHGNDGVQLRRRARTAGHSLQTISRHRADAREVRTNPGPRRSMSSSRSQARSACSRAQAGTAAGSRSSVAPTAARASRSAGCLRVAGGEGRTTRWAWPGFSAACRRRRAPTSRPAEPGI